MWISYGRREASRPAIEAAPLRAVLAAVDRWSAPLAIAVLFAYPNPLVPVALGVLALHAARLLARRLAGVGATPLDAGFALLAVGSLVGFVVAHHREAAQLRLTGIVAAVALFYVVVGSLSHERAVRRASWAILAAVVVGMVVLLALLRGSLPDSTVSRAIWPLLAPFSLFPGVSGDTLDVNTRFAVHQYGLAHLLLVAGAFAAGAAAVGPGRVRSAGLVALLAIVPFLLATQSRGAILALAVAATVVATFRHWLALSLLPAVGGLFYALLARGTISRGVEGEWLSDRLSYWTGTFSMLGDFPLTGVGLGMRSFAEAYAWYQRLPTPYLVSHTHNIFLQAYAEQGLLGMVGLIGLAIAGVAIGLRATRRTLSPDRWLVAGATGAVLGSFLYGLTDQVPSTNLSLALVFALLAVLVAADRLAASGQGHPVERAPRRAESRAPAILPSSARGRLVAALLGVVVVAGGAMIAPRWISGLFLNAGSSELLAVVLD
ncbi:MAG: O-antigen ligase family protein, partial [Chloroflexota bacterium]|nr:O-antigen ligase family protein [Chloroflexota bacterium]